MSSVSSAITSQESNDTTKRPRELLVIGDELSMYEICKRARRVEESLNHVRISLSPPMETLLFMQKMQPSIVAAEVSHITDLGINLADLIISFNTPVSIRCKFCLEASDVACSGKNCTNGVHFDGPDNLKACHHPYQTSGPDEKPLCVSCLTPRLICPTCYDPMDEKQDPPYCAHPYCDRLMHAKCAHIAGWKRGSGIEPTWYCGQHDETQLLCCQGDDANCTYVELPGQVPTEFITCDACQRPQHVGGVICTEVYYICTTCVVTCDHRRPVCAECYESMSAEYHARQACRSCGTGPKETTFSGSVPAGNAHATPKTAMYRCEACKNLYHDRRACRIKNLVVNKATMEMAAVCTLCRKNPRYTRSVDYMSRKCQMFAEYELLGLTYEVAKRTNEERLFLETGHGSLEELAKNRGEKMFYKLYCPWDEFRVMAFLDRSATTDAGIEHRIEDLEEDVKGSLDDVLTYFSRQQRASHEFTGGALVCEHKMPWLLSIDPDSWREECGFSRDTVRSLLDACELD